MHVGGRIQADPGMAAVLWGLRGFERPRGHFFPRSEDKYVVVTCATDVVHVGLVWSGLASAGVDLRHDFAIGAAGSGEVLVAVARGIPTRSAATRVEVPRLASSR